MAPGQIYGHLPLPLARDSLQRACVNSDSTGRQWLVVWGYQQQQYTLQREFYAGLNFRGWSIFPFHGFNLFRQHTHTHCVLYNRVYFAGLIFTVRRSSAKIGLLKNSRYTEFSIHLAYNSSVLWFVVWPDIINVYICVVQQFYSCHPHQLHQI